MQAAPPKATPEARALRLVEILYQASLKPSAWGAFVEALAWDLGEPMVGLNLELPGGVPARISYRAHSDTRFGVIFADFAARRAVPWPIETLPTDRFVRGSEVFPDAELPQTDFYREYMAPQGLAPEGALGHVFAKTGDRPLALIGIYRRRGCRRLDEADLATCNLLVPHLARSYEIFRNLATSQHRREALAQAMDFLPSGVVFLDARGRVVAANRAALQISSAADGFSLATGTPEATHPGAAAEVRSILEAAVERGNLPGQGGHQPFTVPRVSGGKPYAAWVSTLHAPNEVVLDTDPVALLFVNDPDLPSPGMQDQLRSLYGLTPAEAELARLLCEGHSIEQVSELRSVSLHTVRAQLKSIFAKTGTRRQGELVSMALRSLTPAQAEEEEKPASLMPRGRP